MQGCKGRSRQSPLQRPLQLCTRDVGALDQDGGSEGGEKELNSRYFEVRVTGFDNRPNGTVYVRTRRIKNHTKVFGPNNHKNGFAIK